jgi:hypothetical protein
VLACNEIEKYIEHIENASVLILFITNKCTKLSELKGQCKLREMLTARNVFCQSNHILIGEGFHQKLAKVGNLRGQIKLIEAADDGILQYMLSIETQELVS